MRALTMAETREVAGGGWSIAEGAGTGAGLGSFGGAIIGWGARGTLSAAAFGASGFGAIGAAVGVAFSIGWGIGSAINGAINNAVHGGTSTFRHGAIGFF